MRDSCFIRQWGFLPLDRHVKTHPDKTAIIFEPNDLQQTAEHISYKELHSRVCKFSNVLKNNNIQKGDRVRNLRKNKKIIFEEIIKVNRRKKFNNNLITIDVDP